MEDIAIEGKTIDDAIEKACGRFQVSRDKLKIEIIAAGNPGFLGFGATRARIRASRLSIDITLDNLFDRTESPALAMSENPKPPAQKSDRAEISNVNSEAKPAKRIKRGRPDNRPGTAASTEAATKASEPLEQPVSAKLKPAPTANLQEGEQVAEKAKRLLEGILTRMQIPSPVDVEETEEAIVLNIRGDGSGLLIGKRGQNLDAIQYIVNKAVHHTSNGHKMIVIDTEKYRKRREESLIALAMKLGEKVKKTKKPVTVGHMNAHDRRLIHMAMQDDVTLTTKSRGEGEYRKIVILPARRGTDSSAA